MQPLAHTSLAPFAGRLGPLLAIPLLGLPALAQQPSAVDKAVASPGPVPLEAAVSNPAESGSQIWNFHMQNTDVLQGDGGFPAKYSGPNSLNRKGEIQETVTLDVYAGVRLWEGAELHFDGLMWQGFGLSHSFGIENFPDGDAFKAGSKTPNFSVARIFLRQTIGFGGPQEDMLDDQLTLAGKRDISRLTITLGRFTPEDICDNNSYAHDPHTQFMSWAMMGNLAWDYGQDTIGFTTGIALDLNQPDWALRWGFFQMPSEKNGFTAEDRFLTYPSQGDDGPFFKTWATMVEFERRFAIDGHPGAIRFMPWMSEADYASYNEATALLLANPPPSGLGGGAGVTIPQAARAYRFKYGLALNWEQEIAKNVGVFSRLGWNDGHNESWTFADADWTVSLGLSVKGEGWQRPGDTAGLAGVVSGISPENQRFLEAGGADLLDGDGKLSYAPEKALEVYYDFQIWKTVHGALDYQFVSDPAFNRDRGPVSIFGCRLHWEF